MRVEITDMDIAMMPTQKDGQVLEFFVKGLLKERGLDPERPFKCWRGMDSMVYEQEESTT